MIKFFQKLKARKGFTLVELIVVIAIIGVLAAILIPTMLGYVTSSRVTSADSTAAGIEDTIDVFLTAADTAGYGAKQASTSISRVEGICTTAAGAAPSWTINIGNTGAFKSNATFTWSGSGTGTANESKTGVTDPTKLLAIEIANKFPDMKQGIFVAYVAAGDCNVVAYTADSAAPADISDVEGQMNTTNGGWTTSTWTWDGATAGISSTNGLIVGTSPKLNLA